LRSVWRFTSLAIVKKSFAIGVVRSGEEPTDNASREMETDAGRLLGLFLFLLLFNEFVTTALGQGLRAASAEIYTGNRGSHRSLRQLDQSTGASVILRIPKPVHMRYILGNSVQVGKM
jgi:hypothetical protein